MDFDTLKWQKQTRWFLNATTGSDENDGSSATAGAGHVGPIKTIACLVQRLGGNFKEGITIRPIDGTVDDGPRLAQDSPGGGTISGIWNILTLGGTQAPPCPVNHYPGPNGESWQFKTVTPIPSFLVATGTSETRFVGTLHNQVTVGAQASVLTMFTSVQGLNLGLAADIQAGDDVVVVLTTAGVVAGTTRIQILGNSLFGSQYAVQSISGNTLKLDRPVAFDITTSIGSVQTLSFIPQGVRWKGNGMTLTGTGDGLITISGAWDCIFEDIWLDNTGGSPVDGGGILALFDTASYQCYFKNVRTRPNSVWTTNAGIFFAACEDCHALDCTMQNLVQFGVISNYSAYCTFYRTTFANNGSDGANISGPHRGLVFVTCTGSANGNNGWSIEGDDIQLVSCVSSGNQAAGVSLTQTLVPCNKPQIIGGKHSENTQVGITIGNVTGAIVRAVDVSNNVGINLSNGGAASTIDCDASSNFASVGVASTSGSSPITVTTTGNLTGRVGAAVQFRISGVTGAGAGTINAAVTGTLTGPNTFTIAAASTGATDPNTGTVQQVTGTGITTDVAARFKFLTLRGNFGSGGAFTSTVNNDTVEIEGLAYQSALANSNGITNGGNGVLDIGWGRYQLDAAGITPINNISGTLILRGHHLALGSNVGACHGLDSSGTCISLGVVDFSSCFGGQLMFGGGNFWRSVPAFGQPPARRPTSIALAGADVTLTEIQFAFETLVFTGGLTASVNVILPNSVGEWLVDMSGVVFNGHTITFQSGSGSSAAVTTPALKWMRATGANVITLSS